MIKDKKQLSSFICIFLTIKCFDNWSWHYHQLFDYELQVWLWRMMTQALCYQGWDTVPIRNRIDSRVFVFDGSNHPRWNNLWPDHLRYPWLSICSFGDNVSPKDIVILLSSKYSCEKGFFYPLVFHSITNIDRVNSKFLLLSGV